MLERFQHLRQERLSVGLGTGIVDPASGVIEPLSTVRSSLGWNSGFITLYCGTLRRAGRAGLKDLYMEQFLIKGMLSGFQDTQLNLETIAPLPWFDVHSIEVPGAPGESVQCARVLLGATVRDPRRPGLEWRYRWNSVVPASHGYFSVPPTWTLQNYSAAEIGAFTQKAMRLFRRHDVGGRPPVDADCDWYLDAADRYVNEHKGKTPTKAEFVKFIDRPESTMRGHLTDCEYWPWSEFRDLAFPRGRSPRS
jgi:hypothetical protein